ncbi:hypothetical protein [Flagellimonas sp.]|uniref:hypothetical protein n=1 Tax=Flagellimonas sp. TaxID=2058762 RepID=UPI003AB328AC
MTIVNKHFGRTITVGNLIRIGFDKSLNFKKINNYEDLIRLTTQLNQHILSSNNVYHDRIWEIYSIERDKLNLRGSESEIKSILNQEAVSNVIREKLLTMSFTQLFKETLVKNPLIYLYQSKWKWFERDPFQRPYDLKSVLTSEVDNHFFVLEKTGTFDTLFDSNIFEFPITEYQFFLIQLFENPEIVENAFKKFTDIFDVINEGEKKELLSITKRLIEELIFRRFIVVAD